MYWSKQWFAFKEYRHDKRKERNLNNWKLFLVSFLETITHMWDKQKFGKTLFYQVHLCLRLWNQHDSEIAQNKDHCGP